MRTIEAIPSSLKYKNNMKTTKSPAELDKIRKSFETIMFDDDQNSIPLIERLLTMMIYIQI